MGGAETVERVSCGHAMSRGKYLTAWQQKCEPVGWLDGYEMGRNY